MRSVNLKYTPKPTSSLPFSKGEGFNVLSRENVSTSSLPFSKGEGFNVLSRENVSTSSLPFSKGEGFNVLSFREDVGEVTRRRTQSHFSKLFRGVCTIDAYSNNATSPLERGRRQPYFSKLFRGVCTIDAYSNKATSPLERGRSQSHFSKLFRGVCTIDAYSNNATSPLERGRSQSHFSKLFRGVCTINTYSNNATSPLERGRSQPYFSKLFRGVCTIDAYSNKATSPLERGRRQPYFSKLFRGVCTIDAYSNNATSPLERGRSQSHFSKLFRGVCTIDAYSNNATSPLERGRSQSHFSKLFRGVCITAILLLILFNNSFGQPANELYKSAGNAYKEKQYLQAAGSYEKIISQGFTSPEVYYNLGNCYYKLNEVGKSILNYERALKLSPGDEDIQHNLKLAELKVSDRIQPVPQLAIITWWHDVVSFNSPGGWGMYAVICAWLALIAFALSIFIGGRKIFISLAVLMFTLSLASFYFADSTKHSEKNSNNAILMAVSANCKSAPDANAGDLFLIHEGTRLRILDNVGDWYKIRLADGKVGWLEKENFEKI